MIKRQIGELTLTAIFLGAALAIFFYNGHATSSASADHSCCHAKKHNQAALAGARNNLLLVSAQAQDRGQDEEGNPSHTRPEQACNHKPVGGQVQCHCVTDCNGDGSPREDRRCKSFCYKDMCSCPRRPCP
jgi:hypothetical protein